MQPIHLSNPSPWNLNLDALDAERDHQTIVRWLFCYVFPWDSLSVEFAFFRTFAVPTISGLLDETGEFACRPQKRYDDTDLILSEILEHGYDSPHGRAALRRMNQIHRRYAISNEDYLYVLSTFIYEPVRWNARFGWRVVTEKEKLANFYFWREVGRRMNIQGIPDHYAAFEAFNEAYEAAHFRYHPSNARVAGHTRDLFLSWYLPRRLYPLGRPFIYAIMDDRLLQACGFRRPPHWMQRLVAWGLRSRGRLYHRFQRRPFFRTQMRRRTYPAGYAIDELGPDDQAGVSSHKRT